MSNTTQPKRFNPRYQPRIRNAQRPADPQFNDLSLREWTILHVLGWWRPGDHFVYEDDFGPGGRITLQNPYVVPEFYDAGAIYNLKRRQIICSVSMRLGTSPLTSRKMIALAPHLDQEPFLVKSLTVHDRVRTVWPTLVKNEQDELRFWTRYGRAYPSLLLEDAREIHEQRMATMQFAA